MLTRLTLRNNFRLASRCLCDKPSDKDVKKTASDSIQPKKEESSSEKVQRLLKLMISESKTKSENQNMFEPPKTEKAPWRKDKKDVVEVKMEQIEDKITEAAEKVAKAIGGNVKQNEAELLSKVLGKINQTSTTLSDLISGMKVDRTSAVKDDVIPETRGQQVKRLMNKSRENVRYIQRKKDNEQTQKRNRNQIRSTEAVKVDIFAGNPLGIFTKSEPNYGTKLNTWEALNQRELALSTSQPPTNYFHKMIQWTKQGKVWKFPIDNEQGLDKEQEVHFSEHIFLDSHLEGWCPKKGPIRHFMELVCVGLSKNAFYTVEEKRDHIMWYKNYFESKKDILTEVGAWADVPAQNSSKGDSVTA